MSKKDKLLVLENVDDINPELREYLKSYSPDKYELDILYSIDYLEQDVLIEHIQACDLLVFQSSLDNVEQANGLLKIIHNIMVAQDRFLPVYAMHLHSGQLLMSLQDLNIELVHKFFERAFVFEVFYEVRDGGTTKSGVFTKQHHYSSCSQIKYFPEVNNFLHVTPPVYPYWNSFNYARNIDTPSDVVRYITRKPPRSVQYKNREQLRSGLLELQAIINQRLELFDAGEATFVDQEWIDQQQGGILPEVDNLLQQL